MATRSKPNWKVLDTLLPVLEQEGWSHAQMAEDWGMSLAILEGHLTQEVSMSALSKHDYPALIEEYDQRRASGESHQAIKATFESRGINWGTFQNRRTQAKKAQQSTPERTEIPPDEQHTPEHPGTLEGHQEVMEDVSQSVPDAPHIGTDAEQSAAELFDEPDGEVQRAVQTPVQPIDSGVDDSADDSADESQILFLPPEPVQTAVQRFSTGAEHSVDTGAVQRLDRLEEEVHGLAHVVRSLADRLNHLPVQTPMQITALPPYPKGKSVRWNLWILDTIRDEISTLAAERDMSPSQLVQELLWTALRRE
jgi:hypothetical protein